MDTKKRQVNEYLLKNFYNLFHKNTRSFKKVPNSRNFVYEFITKTLDKYIKIRKPKTCLDFGCGSGFISFYLAQKVDAIVGFDISEKAILECKKTSSYLGLKNKCNFYYKNNQVFKKKYDLITCLDVIEHIKKDQYIIKKLTDLLNRKGLIVISVPSKNSLLYKLGFLDNFDRRVGHIRRYSVEDLKKIIKQNKDLKILEVVKTESPLRNLLFTTKLNFFVKFLKWPLGHLFNKFDSLLVKIAKESNIILVASKK